MTPKETSSTEKLFSGEEHRLIARKKASTALTVETKKQTEDVIEDCSLMAQLIFGFYNFPSDQRNLRVEIYSNRAISVSSLAPDQSNTQIAEALFQLQSLICQRNGVDEDLVCYLSCCYVEHNIGHYHNQFIFSKHFNKPCRDSGQRADCSESY